MSHHSSSITPRQKWLIHLRRILAAAVFILITLLFVDFTGWSHTLFGWLAKIQFLPALLALNLVVVAALIVITLLFGRIYCSVICPLGIMQDLFARLGLSVRKNRYSFSPAKQPLRLVMLAVMVVALLIGSFSLAAIIAPYSAFGRIASNLLQPVWIWGNNLLASWAEAHDSYTFYHVDFKPLSISLLTVAVVSLLILAFLSWRNGRTYCNTICPVGTLLSFFARFSLFRPVIDTSKCVNCKLCSRNCKAACIDVASHSIDYTRCVTCFDCIGKCHTGAISYTFRHLSDKKIDDNPDDSRRKVDSSRRQFLTLTAALTTAIASQAVEKTVDGGLAPIIDKKRSKRRVTPVPPGALSLRNLHSHCTACQLCISACPNGVLRPSTEFSTFMKPESSYEIGYCRPECNRCSQVCPTGAIRPVTIEEKSSIRIGRAVWVKTNCIPLTDGVECGNCARHCPSGAILMVDSGNGVRIPAVNEERCIGCGACENLFPARPYSAIYVEGHEIHTQI